MVSVYDLVEEIGPCLASDLARELVEREGITPAAARKRVSRGDSRLKKLLHLFPRNTTFVYIEAAFGTDRHWERLTDTLLETNAAYGKALACLIERGGIIPESHFEIACGAPRRLSKHLSPPRILDSLIKAGLLERTSIPGVGACVALIKGNDRYTENAATIRARLLAEKIFLEGFESWAKKLGLVSFEKSKLRDEGEDHPQVGSFSWDFTAPSYLGGLISSNENTKKPGFLVADILFNVDVSKTGLEPFIYKCETIRSLNVGRTLNFFLAESFSQEAFSHAKTRGIVPATPETLFGKEVAEGFRHLISVIAEAGQNSINPETLDTLFDRLAKFEGAVANLRGTLFEYLVADIIEKTLSPRWIRLNEKIRSDNGQASEIDIVAECHKATHFIECKGYAPYATLPHSEVVDWLTKRVPNVYSYACTHPDWKKTSLNFELWTTGKLSEDSIAAIDKISKSVRSTKYTLSYKDANSVRAEAYKTNDKKLLNTLEQHFLTHPASPGRRQ